jgi:hypothetical protein
MKETGSYFNPGGMPAYQVNMNVTNAASAPSTYSGSDRTSYYNGGGQTPGNAYFNQMPPPMPTAMPQNPSYNSSSSAPSPWNINMGAPPVHPGQSPSPGVGYYPNTPAPSAPPFTVESSGISSTSTPPPISPSVAGSGSNYQPWANPSAQTGSSSTSAAPVSMDAYMTAQQEKAQYSGAYQVSEKSQFTGGPAPFVTSSHAGGSNTGTSAGEPPKPVSDTPTAPNQGRNNATEEEEVAPVGLPPPAYTFTAQ